MFKLMKYEFRKWRLTLGALAVGLAALQIAFFVGHAMNRTGMMSVALVLISILAFAAFAYLVIAGIASYSLELRDKSGYLIFMTPVRPLGIVLSKLVFIALTALAAMALFGTAAYFDFRFLVKRVDLDASTMDQIDLMLRFGLKTNASVRQIVQMVGFSALSVLLQVLLTMCTAYLAITLSATLLQNRKGFLRGLISFTLFAVLSWGSSWLTQKLFYANVDLEATAETLQGVLGWSVLLNFALCALFCWASAWLLDHKVNL